MADKIAVVVGGTSGIGLATAELLAQRGAQVHVTGRSEHRFATVAERLPQLHLHRADGTRRADMNVCFDEIGTVDWLVLSMSGGKGAGPFAELDPAELRAAFDAKFWGQLNSMQAALPHLAPDASVTLVSAGSARSSIPGTSGLAALNGALEAMVKPLAVELAPKRVNAVSPGLVDTPWWSVPDVREAYFDAARASLPVRRIATAQDVAECVVLAATNPNMTGTVIESDGGARLVSLG